MQDLPAGEAKDGEINFGQAGKVKVFSLLIDQFVELDMSSVNLVNKLNDFLFQLLHLSEKAVKVIEITLLGIVLREMDHAGPFVVGVKLGKDFDEGLMLQRREESCFREDVIPLLFESPGFDEEFGEVATPAAEVGLRQIA